MADVKLLRKLPSLYDVSSPLLSKSWSNYPDIFSTGNHIYFVRIIHNKPLFIDSLLNIRSSNNYQRFPRVITFYYVSTADVKKSLL